MKPQQHRDCGNVLSSSNFEFGGLTSAAPLSGAG
jgi:hypothetical protein